MDRYILPTFIIVGTARGGTTALFKWLSVHPEIFMSPVKETNFFVHDILGRGGPGDIEAIPDIYFENIGSLKKNRLIHAGLINSLETYGALFLRGKGVKSRGEASPAYLYFASESSKRIFRLLPACRILMLLRDPVERAWSNYKVLFNAGREQLEPKVAFLNSKKRIEEGWEHFWDYLGIGLYAQQVRAFLDVFPREQVGIWLFEDLMRDKQQYYREILRFIGVNENFLPNFSKENTSTNKQSFVRLHLRRIPLIRSLTRKFLPKMFRKVMIQGIDKMFGKELELDPDLRSWLLDFYRDDIIKLHQIVPELDVLRWIENQEKKIVECHTEKRL